MKNILRSLDIRIVSLSTPLVLGMLSNFLFQTVDAAMVAQLGAQALSGVGVGAGILFVYIAILSGLQGAVQSQFSLPQKIRATDILGQSVLCAIVLGGGLTILSLALLKPTVGLYSSEAQILTLARSYLLYALPSLLFHSVGQAFGGYFVGVLNTTVHFKVTVACQIINLLANYCLIYGKFGFPRMEVAGAGMGTWIAEIACVVIYAYYVLDHIKWKWPKLENPLPFRQILQLIWPLSLNRLSFSLIWNAQIYIAGLCGYKDLAILSVINKLQILPFYIAFGVGAASSSLVGHAMVRGQRKKAQLISRRSVVISTVAIGVISLIFFVFNDFILQLFFTDFEVKAAAFIPFLIFLVFSLTDGFGSLFQRILIGVAQGKNVLYASTGSQWLLLVPLSYVMAVTFDGGIIGMMYAYLIYKVVFSVWTGVLLKKYLRT